MRWVGLDEVMVAVPVDWVTTTQACEPPSGDVVWVPDQEVWRSDCGDRPISGVSSVTVTIAGAGVVPLGRRVDIGRELNGLDASTSGLTCRGPAPQACRVSIAISGSDAVFDVRVQGRDAKARAERILGSVRRVPDGHVAVPAIELGTSVGTALATLAAAGLDGLAPEVDFPHYATGTVPPAGSVVPKGRSVELTIGDG